jgi:hypothetical protein
MIFMAASRSFVLVGRIMHDEGAAAQAPLSFPVHAGPVKPRRLFCPTSQARRAKIFFFSKVRIYDLTKRSRAFQEGRFANATTRGAGGDGRVGPQGVRHSAYGQAVWS